MCNEGQLCKYMAIITTLLCDNFCYLKMSANRIWKAWKIITFLFDLYFLTLLEKSCDTFLNFFDCISRCYQNNENAKNNLMHVNSYTEQKSKETILFWHEYWSDRYVFFASFYLSLSFYFTFSVWKECFCEWKALHAVAHIA